MKRYPIIFLILFFLLPICVQAATLDEIKSLVHSLENKYAIKFYYESLPKDYDDLDYEFATKEDYADLYHFLKLFETEFDKYPPSFISKIKLKSIGIVKSLEVLYMYKTKSISGIEKAGDNRFIVDFKAGNYNANYQRHIIHHELFHLIDKQIHNGVFNNDPAWNELNTSLDLYGIYGLYSSSPYESIINHPNIGFINRYSESAIEEDKANIFASLFIYEDYSKIIVWKDKIIFKKIDYIKNTLHKIDDKFNKQYWGNLHISKLKFSY